MLCEFFINLFCSLIETVIGGLGALSLPFDVAKVLATITGYGSFVVGADLLVIVGSCITFWLATRFAVGILVFIWRLLPFI